MVAQCVEAISVLEVQEFQGVRVLITSCTSYEEYKSLPKAVKFEGMVFGKTGWNSDTGRAYYRTDALIARVIKGA